MANEATKHSAVAAVSGLAAGFLLAVLLLVDPLGSIHGMSGSRALPAVRRTPQIQSPASGPAACTLT